MRLRFLVATVVLVGVFAFFSKTTNAPEADKVERGILPDIERGEIAMPVVKGDQVTFYAQGDGGSSPRVISDVTGWGERANGDFDFSVGKMHAMAGTNWFTLSTRINPAARIEYLFAYGVGDFRVDPRNPRKVSRPTGDASEVVGSSYVPPPEFAEPPVAPAGKITEASVRGLIVGQRHVIVYTPPGYDPSRKYPLAVFHDGGLVVNTGEAPRVLDWLIAHDKIHPLVGVFVEPVSRVDDFQRDAPMRDFVSSELMAWIADHYSVTPLAADHAIIGISAGARGALAAMSAYPNVFGKSGLMIPAVDVSDTLKVPVRQGAAPQLEVVLLAGEYDRLNRGSAQAARDEIKQRGHAVTYIEVPEGHSTMTWKTHLREVLITLFGR